MGATCANLAGRVYNASHITYSMLIWKGDCCVIKLPRMKNDQEGEKTIDRHVYINYRQPLRCMLFWVAIRIVSMISAATCQYIVGDDGRLLKSE